MNQEILKEIKRIVNNPELLEIGRKAIEDVLVDFRDSRISIMRNNGLVIRERDGEYSRTIRLSNEDAIRIGMEAIVKSLEKSNG